MYTAASSRARRCHSRSRSETNRREVERDLIVAAAARVELAHVAHEFGEAAFDVHVDVFQFFFHWKVPSSISARTAARPATS